MNLLGLLLLGTVFRGSLQCSVTEVKSLLEGCDRLAGLNVTSVGGTIVNDHNCDVLLPKQVFYEEPLFQYPIADSKKFYTLVLVDPDAPPQLDGEFFLHMLKSNIPGLALKAKESSKTVGVDYRPYKPPTPPHGTGAHRYIGLLYEQADGNNFLPNVPPTRSRFALADWLRGKNLCGPVAATQFRSYKPPTPPHGTGAHRYIGLLYEQADGNNFLPNVPPTRSRFALADWLRGKNLCGPVAATQFRCQY